MNKNAGSRGQKSDPDFIWNILTLVLLVGTICVVLYSFSLLTNPYSDVNFFPPDTPTKTLPPPSWTPLALEPTWTSPPTVPPLPTLTRRPTFTTYPTDTPYIMLTPTSLLTATITPKPTGAPYAATISYHDSTTFRPDTDCTKLWIAGRVTDANKKPVIGLIVKMGGSLPGKSFTPADVKLTGLATAYGPSGFEFDTGLEPVASTNTLWVQIYNQANAALSTPILITTYKDCKKNLVLITFQEK